MICNQTYLISFLLGISTLYPYLANAAVTETKLTSNVHYDPGYHALSIISRHYPSPGTSISTIVVLHLSTGIFNCNGHEITGNTLTPHEPADDEVERLKEKINQYIISEQANGNDLIALGT